MFIYVFVFSTVFNLSVILKVGESLYRHHHYHNHHHHRHHHHQNKGRVFTFNFIFAPFRDRGSRINIYFLLFMILQNEGIESNFRKTLIIILDLIYSKVMILKVILQSIKLLKH